MSSWRIFLTSSISLPSGDTSKDISQYESNSANFGASFKKVTLGGVAYRVEADVIKVEEREIVLDNGEVDKGLRVLWR